MDFVSKFIQGFVPSEDAYDNYQFLLQYYETYYRINDFTVPGKPLDAIAVHPKEVYYQNDLYDNRLREFLRYDVHKNTGINFDDFLRRPAHEIESIFLLLQEKFDLQILEAEKAKAKHEQDSKRGERSNNNRPKQRNLDLGPAPDINDLI